MHVVTDTVVVADVDSELVGDATGGVVATNNGVYDQLQQQIDDLFEQARRLQSNMSQVRICYLFAGKSREESLDEYVKLCGGLCDAIDIERDATFHDMLESSNWDCLQQALNDDHYKGFFASPPCSTFSAARKNDGYGPVPLRGEEPPEIYGLPNLSTEDRKKVLIGNTLALIAATSMMIMLNKGWPSGYETPARRKGKPSVFKLPEIMLMIEKYSLEVFLFPQCQLGAKAEKLTEVIASFDLSLLSPVCNHVKSWWTVPFSGRCYFSAHPPLCGKQWAIPAEHWRKEMLGTEPTGDFITRELAAYPPLMNKLLAATLVSNAVKQHRVKLQHQSMLKSLPSNDEMGSSNSRDQSGLPVIKSFINVKGKVHNFSRGLRPQDDVCIGGLRDTWKSCDKVPGHGQCSILINDLLDDFLEDHPTVISQCLLSIGADSGCMVPDVVVQKLRNVFALQLQEALGISSVISTEPVKSSWYSTCVRAQLLYFWGLLADDPAANVAKWLMFGTPAGITRDMPELSTLFPTVEDDRDPDLHFDDLFTDFDSFRNYSNVEDNDAAVEAILNYHKKGYIKQFDSLDQVRKYLGAEPILSKFGCISKQKTNPVTGKTKMKHRIILDSKESSIVRVTNRQFKSVLPRATDAAFGTVDMLRNRTDAEDAALFVIDIMDAFWLLPLHKDERRFFVGKLHDKFYVFLRTPQGSRGAPLTWAALASLAGRCIQSLFRRPDQARMQVYVDDPLTALVGTKATINRNVCKIILCWLVLGFPLAFDKAQLGPALTWIGMQYSISLQNQACLMITIPQEKISELYQLTVNLSKLNVIPLKTLRSYAGKVNNIASLLFVWRPFLATIWAAMSTANEVTQSAPPNTVWTKQILHALMWIKTFLSGKQMITRTFLVDSYAPAAKITICTDASPWGLGAYLIINEKPVAWFAAGLDPVDIKVLGLEVGSHTSQQLVEALCMLIALREWKCHWLNQRVCLKVRADNVATLVMVATLRTSSAAMSIIARELALDIGDSVYAPDIVEHVSGLLNDTADMLSRKFQPNNVFRIPSILKNVQEVRLLSHSLSWWRSVDSC